MSPNKYTGPWAPGMRDIDGGYPFGASLVVTVGAHGLPDRWVLLSEPETIRYTNTREESEYAWKGCSPDWADPATVGALSGVVRSLYNEPRLDTVWIDWTGLGGHAGFCLGWYAFSSTAGTVTFETCVGGGAVQHPTREGAWLAAYHAHRDAAGTTANDIEVIRG